MPYEIEIPGRAIVEVPDDVPLEEAQRALAKQYPPTGDDIADALKTDPTFVPTKDQFKTYEAWSKTKQTDWMENIAAGVSGLLDTASKGVVAGAQGAALNPANYLEGVAQSMHQLYGMVAQSQDPDSVLFKLKDLVSGGGTDEDRYNQFLDARKYNEQAIKYAEGKETVLPKEMVNPEFAQMVALAADPLYALPGLGELLGVGKLATRATGLATKAAGKGVEAIARPLESAIKAGADIVTETTGLGEGGLRSIAASAAGAGLAAGSPIAAGLAAAPALVSGAREVGQAIATAGENLMTQPSRIGALEAVGMAPGANLRQRALAAVGRLGGDAAVDYGLRGTAGALEGAALGAGLGYASGGEEGAAQGIGQGALQGAAGAVSARMLKQATGLAAKEARIGDFRRFVESQNDPKTAELLGQIEKHHGVDVAAGFMDLKGIVEGTLGDIPVKIQSAKDFQAEHGTARGITITMGDKPQIFINADSFKGKGDDPFYTLAHEAFHAFDQVEQLRNATSEIKQALVGTYLDDGTGGRRLVREGLLDPADVQRRFDQYAAKFPDGHSEKARLLGLDEAARTDYVAGELGSEYFGRLMRGYKPDSLLRGFNGVTRGLADMALMQSASQSLQRIAAALDSRFGVKPTDSILFPGLKEASPQLNAMLRTLVRTRKNLDEAVVKADNDPTVIRQADLSNPAAAKIAVDSGLAKTTSTGKVELLTKQEVIKQEEHTVDVIKKVIASTPITDTSQPFARIVDGEAVGTVSKEQVNALLASPILPSRIKQKIALAQSLIDEGRSGFLQYAAATKDRKNKITGKIGRAYSSAIPVSAREVIPYALEISKAGNPYIQTIDLTKVRGALERSSRGDGSVGPYATMTDVFNDLARYFNNLDQGASAQRSVDVFGPDKAKFLTDLVNEKRPGGTSSPFYRSFRLDRVISAAPRDFVAKVTPTSVEMAGKRWMPTERIGNTDVVNSEAGFRIIHADGKKWRLYDKSGALKGVYDTQREAEKKAARFMPIDEEQDLHKRVSTRNPTAKKATEDPLTQELSINVDAIKQIPGALPKIVKKLQRYDGLILNGKTSDEKITQFKDFIKDNLLYLYDSVPEATRIRSSKWYDGARRISVDLGSQYKLSTEAVAGVLASLSPQMDWYKNVSLAKRVLSIVTKESKPAFDGELLKWAENATGKNSRGQTVKVIRPEMVDSMRGKDYNDMTLHQKAVYVRAFDEAYHSREYNIISPEGDELGIALNSDEQRTASKVAWGSLLPIMKSITILENPTKATISRALGNEHKVRSFFNNIIVPNNPRHGDVTIDTHAVAAGMLLPLSGSAKEVAHSFGAGMPGSSVHGVSGTYGIIADGYREAAAARGVLPRQMQSITWEAIRGLFSPAFKRSKGVDQVRKIWKSYKEGKATLNDTRSKIVSLAGGITAPTWE